VVRLIRASRRQNAMSDIQTQKEAETLDEALEAEALQYHSHPKPGKIEVIPSKPLTTQRELALAYSPGVASACEAIAKSPDDAMLYTSRSNLVAVISNGTAVLGLGAIGALASKPVMEGKGVLFKKFGGVNVFDLEIDEKDPQKLVDIIASLEPTFGGINLEDIKAPECFFIENELKRRMKIPVFHDDQHGTAIVAAAALLNALKVVDKAIEQVRFVCSGAGAAAIACMDLLVHLGLNKENILVCDSKGVIHTGRENLEPNKQRYAAKTSCRTLAEALSGADILLGVSGPKTMDTEMVRKMAAKPVILALANPEPEIRPELVRSVRDDAVIATGRSDYPNQVNNVLCFPYIFRGALDVGATTINKAMKCACVHALAALAHNNPAQSFGADYLIPSPFDTRLRSELPLAVAKAAMESGAATRPIDDLEKYRATLSLSL
jgi:malate dehydrogenase (oxaloacetate-decarboxylating)(NADP+)